MCGLSKILLTFLILLNSAATYGQTTTKPTESPKPTATSPNKPTKQPIAETKPTPPTVEITPPSESNPKPKQSGETNTNHSTPDWWLISVTFLLFVATAGLVWYARDTARRQLRAYVSIIAVYPIKNTIIDGLPAYEIIMRNTGQTPAYAVKTWRGIGINPRPLLNRLPPPPTPVSDTDGVLGIQADRAMKVEKQATITQEDIESVRAGTAAIYVFGEVEYWDAFKIKHFTSFCLYESVGMDKGNLRYSEIGNDAD